MRTFKDIIDDYKDNNEIEGELLPFCHTTKYHILFKYIITDDNNLIAQSGCDYHNDEKLIFLFYGKSSYFPPSDQVDKYDKDPPVTLLYEDLHEKENLKRLCCFDSGAYLNGRFNFENPNAPEPVKMLQNFIVENPEKEDIIAGVKALYRNNENYLRSEFTPYYDVEKKQFCLCLTTINDIHQNKNESYTEYGPQAFTFEVQVEDQITSKPNVIFLPESKARDEETILGWSEYFPGTEIVTYKHDQFTHIHTAYHFMRDKVINYKNRR
ncbi:hypothetical protein [Tenacibaculum sp. 190524A05c]|uniref:Uncharacterized protein n=1 Tax=Tenacibaculum platacis TaxID=3137852 RepID=A0ABP1EFM8_9FLAO